VNTVDSFVTGLWSDVLW